MPPHGECVALIGSLLKVQSMCRLSIHAKELERINGALTRQGLTLVPTKIYFNNRGWAKVEVAVGQGKKQFDKRDDIKKRENKREMDRAMKQRRK